MSEVIQLENVSKLYRQGPTIIKALDGINLSIGDSARMVVILGPSGSGKTTFLYMLGALERPTRGQVVVLGQDLGGLSESQLTLYRRQTVGFVFQTYNLIPNLTALENVALPMEFYGVDHREATKKAGQLLGEVNMARRASHAPAKLSGGEQQRVAIARALANDPQIILADEPTGNLDSVTGEEIVRLLKELAEQRHKTVIVVTHDEKIVELADITFHIRDGKIV